jgi:hypothetical protein
VSALHPPMKGVRAQQADKTQWPGHNRPARPALQLRCTACGSQGRIPTIALPPDDPRPVLRLAFLPNGPGLLCAPRCRDEQA